MALISGRIRLSKLMLALIAASAVAVGAASAFAVDNNGSLAAEDAALKKLERDGNAVDAEAAAFVRAQQAYAARQQGRDQTGQTTSQAGAKNSSSGSSDQGLRSVASSSNASGSDNAGQGSTADNVRQAPADVDAKSPVLATSNEKIAAVNSAVSETKSGTDRAGAALMGREANDAAVADATSTAGVAAAAGADVSAATGADAAGGAAADKMSEAERKAAEAQAAEARADAASRRVLNKVEQGAKKLTIERTFSVSHISVPQRCEERKFKAVCTRLVNYYARRFERDMVSQYSTMYTASSDQFNREGYDLYRDRERGVQNVSMSMYSPPGDPVMTLFSIFNQHIPNNENGEEILIVETINFDSRTGKFIPFNELFENHELAAMLCARAIEAKYQKYGSKLLPVVISATQLRPSNFIITAKGLRFFFAPGLVKPNSKSAESIFIKLDKLQAAKPNMKWWEGKRRVLTTQQRDAVNNSKLKSVIDLDEIDKQHREQPNSASTSKCPSSEGIVIDGNNAIICADGATISSGNS